MGKVKSNENVMIGKTTREACYKKYEELKLNKFDKEAVGKVAKALNMRLTKKSARRLKGVLVAYFRIHNTALREIQNVDPAESASGMDDDADEDEAAEKKGAKKGKAAKK